MLNLPELISAVKLSAKDFQSEICWTAENQFTIQVSANFNGKTLSAWGSNENEAIAFGKAVMELAERMHMTQMPISWRNLKTGSKVSQAELQAQYSILSIFSQTSSGLAAHLSESKAITNAVAEAIERHVLTKATFECIPPNIALRDKYLWLGPMGHFVALAAHKPEQGGILFASSASKSQTSAFNGAERELSAMREWATNPSNIKELIDTHKANHPSETQAYYLTKSPDLSFLRKTSRVIVSPQITAANLWIASLPVLPHFERIKSFCVVRVFSPFMQPLQFGPLRDAVINPLAIDLNQFGPTVEYNVVA